MKKKTFLMASYTLAIYLIVIGSLFTSCGSPTQAEPQPTTTVSNSPLNAEYLGNVGKGHRGDFSVFRFEVDGVTYIVASEYNGGMALIDKIDKR